MTRTKKMYKGHHIKEYVSVEKMRQALMLLKKLGHKDYQEFELNSSEDDFLSDDEGVEDDNNLSNEDSSSDEKDTEYKTKDSVAKFQFDYNEHTMFVNDHPEIHFDKSVTVCPGEGKVPVSFLTDKYWDRAAFPTLDPTGENCLNAEREVKLRYQDFFEQRLFNSSMRFNNPTFLFAALHYTESKKLQDNINIAFQRGKASDGGRSYSLHDAYTVLDNIKGTARYCKKKKNEFICKLENLGPFHVFFTLR